MEVILLPLIHIKKGDDGMFNDAKNSFDMMFTDLVNGIPNVIKALLILLVAWAVAVLAKAIIQKLLVKVGVAKGLTRTPLFETEEDAETMLDHIGKLVYFLVFILFLPAVFSALNMTAVSGPIENMMGQIFSFIPNLIAATIIVLIGVFVAKLVKELFKRFFLTINIDKWFKKVNQGDSTNQAKSQVTISNVIANVIYIIVIIPFITIGLEALNIASISRPIESVLSNVLAIIPNLFVAIILVMVGHFVGKFLGNLLRSLLVGVGLAKVLESLGFTNVKKQPFDIAKFVGVVVHALILLFFSVEALRVINLEVLNTIGSAVILYLPFLLSALLIISGGLFLANVVGNWVKNNLKSPMSAILIKVVIIVFAVFMTLDQLQFATAIVNTAFLLILGGLMVAFALSFGLGGRDFAKETLAKVQTKFAKEDEFDIDETINKSNQQDESNKVDQPFDPIDPNDSVK